MCEVLRILETRLLVNRNPKYAGRECSYLAMIVCVASKVKQSTAASTV